MTRKIWMYRQIFTIKNCNYSITKQPCIIISMSHLSHFSSNSPDNSCGSPLPHCWNAAAETCNSSSSPINSPGVTETHTSVHTDRTDWEAQTWRAQILAHSAVHERLLGKHFIRFLIVLGPDICQISLQQHPGHPPVLPMITFPWN